MTLALLADVKSVLDIGDTSQDSKLNLFIQDASFAIQDFLGYPVEQATYTSELYAINNNQYLYLRKAAIQSVAAVSIQGAAVVQGGIAGNGSDDGWQMTDEDAAIGRIYRAIGWLGRTFTRGMTYDPVAGARDIAITYTAGWLCPGDAGYTVGAPGSLPYTIMSACILAVAERFRISMVGAEGFVQYKEGGVAAMLEQKAAPGGISSAVDGSGLSENVQGKLNPWRRRAVA